MKLIETIRAILDGRKTYGIGAAGILLGVLVYFGVVDLDLTVGEQVQIWLGSFATITVRAAISKLFKRDSLSL